MNSPTHKHTTLQPNELPSACAPVHTFYATTRHIASWYCCWCCCCLYCCSGLADSGINVERVSARVISVYVAVVVKLCCDCYTVGKSSVVDFSRQRLAYHVRPASCSLPANGVPLVYATTTTGANTQAYHTYSIIRVCLSVAVCLLLE